MQMNCQKTVQKIRVGSKGGGIAQCPPPLNTPLVSKSVSSSTNIWPLSVNNTCCPQTLLNYLLPSKRNYTMQLRPKGHNFTIPHILTTLLKNSFINRCIFGIVWLLLWLQLLIVYISDVNVDFFINPDNEFWNPINIRISVLGSGK